MPRPSPETLFHTYTEVYTAWNVVGQQTTPFSLRDFYREYTSGLSPNWPRVKLYNPLHVYYSRAFVRTYATMDRVSTSNPSFWDKIVFTFRGPTFVQPSGLPNAVGDVSHDPNIRRRAIDKAMDKVLDRKVNLGQFIAERQQVANSVNDVVKRLTGAIHAVRRRDGWGAARALGLSGSPPRMSGNIAKDWLAFQYGWKPLLSDVKGAAEHLAEQQLKKTPRLIVHAKVKQSLPPAFVLGGVIGMTNCVKWQFDEGQSEAHTRLEYFLTNDFQRAGAQLGLTDPLTLAWELLPYSFVVDWFIPIGAFIGRLNYDSGLIYLGGSTTLHSTQWSRVTTLASTQIVPPNRCTLSSTEIVAFKAMRVDREVHVTAPKAVFPAFKDPFSPYHVANALALMRVAFGR